MSICVLGMWWRHCVGSDVTMGYCCALTRHRMTLLTTTYDYYCCCNETQWVGSISATNSNTCTSMFPSKWSLGKGKYFPVRAMKAYRVIRGITSLILNLSKTKNLLTKQLILKRKRHRHSNQVLAFWPLILFLVLYSTFLHLDSLYPISVIGLAVAQLF
jgi:hypothetical protein